MLLNIQKNSKGDEMDSLLFPKEYSGITQIDIGRKVKKKYRNNQRKKGIVIIVLPFFNCKNKFCII